MVKRILVACSTIFCLSILMSLSASARMALDAGDTKGYNSGLATVTADCAADHRVGKLQLTVNNVGGFGDGFLGVPDCFTGQSVVGGVYPKGSGIRYMFAGAFWIGAVVGRDTLVSIGADGWTSGLGEMKPDEPPFGNMIHRSLIDPASPEYEGAISEDDILAVYMDTLTPGPQDERDNRGHRPLNVKIQQNSYAWSYAYAEDFVLFDYKITNMGLAALEKVYMGIYVDADVGLEPVDENMGFQDDICGFVESVPETLLTRSGGYCIYQDTVNIAWISDNDGDPDPTSFKFTEESCPGVTATRIVRTPKANLEVSFNWWISNGAPALDFGPREREFKGALQEKFYNWGFLGTPEGDRVKYYVMRNREFDYDQIYTASIRPDDTLWLQPNPSQAVNFAKGFDTRYLLSFGPFDIDPGETLPLSFAYVAGENFHIDGHNLDNLTVSYEPDAFYANLNFKDLTTNARWASWIYDNPGVDTDGDGDYGKYVICSDSTDSIEIAPGVWEIISDTIFVGGDGVPDFQGAKPPPAPDFEVIPETGKLTMRFNGLRSETTPDAFLARGGGSSGLDFEGYRVYIGRDDRAASYTMVASYDREDYNKYVFIIDLANPDGTWKLFDVPYSLDSLQTLYGHLEPDSVFRPLDYPHTSPLIFQDPVTGQDSVLYFVAQDYNAHRPGIDTDIRKRFPDQPYPSSLDPELADPSEFTEDGKFKYFEYEFVLENLLPTIAYWVNVTAFDFGSPASGLPSLESSRTIGAIAAYAQPSAMEVDEGDLKVYVYPNPYRIDANYRESGYEGRDSERDRNSAVDRVRRVNFANVPVNCRISIYSLDGDLVRELEHHVETTDPTASHAEWDMITRNTQLVVSGVYYWSVENLDTGDVQIGKLVVIM